MPTLFDPLPLDRLHVAVVQTDIVWEAPQANLQRMEQELGRLQSQTKADIVVFPEVITTGFSPRIREIAEEMPSTSLLAIARMAQRYDTAIASSIMVQDGESYYNRAFLATPQGEMHFQDKKHLFHLAGEAETVSPAQSRQVINYNGWNIFLICCYDLRFPVWTRNVGNEYDLAIVVANWPHARSIAWKALNQARAIENLCYLCAANRTGTDPQGVKYLGDSAIYSYKGEILADAALGQETVLRAEISRADLNKFRTKFPVWQDADSFTASWHQL